MTRQLVAIAPIREAHWSGLRGVGATGFGAGVDRFVAVSVRVRIGLDTGVWMPGLPIDTFRALFVNSLPSDDDLVPIKDAVDVSASFEGVTALRDKSLEVRSGEGRALIDGRAPALDAPPVSDGASISIERDAKRFQHAPPEARLGALKGDLSWSIDGATAAEGEIGFGVALRADYSDGLRSVIDMHVDTVHLLLAERAAELVYRGLVVDSPGRLLDRLIIGVVPKSKSDDDVSALLDAGLPTARFVYAANVDDARKRTRPPEPSEEEMVAARMSAWSEGPGEPSLTPDEYGAIVAELARRPRKEVLADNGFDEISWTREEWAVGELLARASREMGRAGAGNDAGEPSLDPEMQEWVDAMRPRAAKGAVDLDAFARLFAHLSTRDPGKVLAERQLSVAEFMAMEAAVAERVDADPREADKLEALVEKHRPEALALAERETEEEVGDE